MFSSRSAIFSAAMALGLLTAGAQAQAPAASHRTGIAMLGQWAVVEVQLNGDPRPRTFIVDTAAGATVIDQALATELGLAPGGEASQVQGASGGAALSGSASLRSLAVAGVSAGALEVVVTDMARFGKGEFHYDGILGNDVLRRHAVTIDLPGGTMTLADSDRPAGRWTDCRANALGATRPEAQAGFAGAHMSLPGGATALAIIDSGAARTVLNWPAASAAGLSKDRPGVTPGPASGGFNGSGGTLYSNATISGLSLGGVSLSPFAGRIGDLAVFKSFDLEQRAGIILGIDVLKQRPFGIARGAAQFCI